MKAKAETKQASPTDRCSRCGHPRHEHWGVNYSDGPHVAGEVLVCPTAVFRSEDGADRR